MRILHTVATYHPLLDGVAEVMRHISEGLVRRGHEVFVATGQVDGIPSGRDDVNGVHVQRFAVRGNRVGGMYGELPAYRKFVAEGKWDLLVNHCVQIWSTDALLDEIASYSWPSLLVSHGFSALKAPGYVDYFKDLSGYLAQYAGWVCISALSEEIEYARTYGILRPVVIENGIDDDEWARADMGVRRQWQIGNSPWLLNVSNHNPLKGHAYLFRLTTMLQNESAIISIIGRSYPAARWNLGKLGVRGGCYYSCLLRSLLRPSVKLHLNVPRSEVVSVFKEADMLVSTSLREANSIVILEAMAAGIPWVSFDVGSVRGHVGGFVAENLYEMCEKVRLLIHDPPLRRELGAQGKQRVQEKHLWSRIVPQYEALYHRLASQDDRR